MSEDVETPAAADPVTSTVVVTGTVTVRTYSDGAVQRNIWETEDQAAEYAASVAAQEGTA